MGEIALFALLSAVYPSLIAATTVGIIAGLLVVRAVIGPES